jgi:rod shape-determining protein MreC
VRALILGDNSADLRLAFMPDGTPVYPGDEVYTSGSDGVLPRGLRVGVVTGAPGAFRVKPYAELNALDAVSVLFFDTPALSTTDPSVVQGAGALSPPSVSPPEVTSEATPAAPALETSVKHAGAATTAASGEGPAQAEQ